MEEKCFGPVRFIPGESHGKYPYCHSIYVEGSGVLIDPGSDRERLGEIRESPGVKKIWLSHWHEDHAMYLGLFDGLPLYSSEGTAPILSDLETFMDAYGIGDDFREDWRRYFIGQCHFRSRKITGFLKDGEIIHLDTVTVEVIETPGHTCGHLAFFFKEPGVLFMGDHDLTKFGPWYADLYSSIDETIASVQRLKNIPAKVWITSHETGVFEEDPGKAWDQYLNVISDRERKLMEFLGQPKALQEIGEAWIVHGKPLEPRHSYEFIERAYMKKHLERLIAEGRVGRVGEKYCKL
jgi:hydroxyacylglutathione hydrolase